MYMQIPELLLSKLCEDVRQVNTVITRLVKDETDGGDIILTRGFWTGSEASGRPLNSGQNNHEASCLVGVHFYLYTLRPVGL